MMVWCGLFGLVNNYYTQGVSNLMIRNSFNLGKVKGAGIVGWQKGGIDSSSFKIGERRRSIFKKYKKQFKFCRNIKPKYRL